MDQKLNQELNEEYVKKIMTLPAEVRGVVFKTDGEYILREKGEEGLRQLEEKLKSFGHPIEYKKIEALSFYPAGLRLLSLLTIQQLFSFDNEKIKEMGTFASRTSLMIKLFINYFLSVEKVFFNEAPKIWKKHYSIGELIPVSIDQEKKIGIIQLKDCDLHPLFCLYLGSYLCGFFQMLIKSPGIYFQETKCTFRGDKFHEYQITWK